MYAGRPSGILVLKIVSNGLSNINCNSNSIRYVLYLFAVELELKLVKY